jgi:tetratricopeptide (TPR) repeat protein
MAFLFNIRSTFGQEKPIWTERELTETGKKLTTDGLIDLKEGRHEKLIEKFDSQEFEQKYPEYVRTFEYHRVLERAYEQQGEHLKALDEAKKAAKYALLEEFSPRELSILKWLTTISDDPSEQESITWASVLQSKERESLDWISEQVIAKKKHLATLFDLQDEHVTFLREMNESWTKAAAVIAIISGLIGMGLMGLVIFLIRKISQPTK